jgi:hypothetical protein
VTTVIRALWTPILRVFGRSRDREASLAAEQCAPSNDSAPAGLPCPGEQPPANAPDSARETSDPSPAAASSESVADFATHLEFLGYSLEATPDGWHHASHRVRYNFSLRPTEVGLRMHCAITIGATLPGGRRAWLEFVNTANDRALVSRFALVVDDDSLHTLRVRNLFTGPYERLAFGTTLDMWHEDLALLRHAPPPDGRSEQDTAVKAADIVIH